MINRISYKWFILLILFVVLVVMGVFILDDDVKLSDDKENIGDNRRQEVTKIVQAMNEAKKAGDNGRVVELEKELLNYLPEKIQKAAQLAESANLSIEFVGKVIDQNSMPIANATISYSTMGLWNMTKGSRGSVTTDQSGIFAISAQGNKLFIQMPEHPNIAEASVPSLNEEVSLEPRKRLQFEPGKGIYNGSEGWGGYTKNNPYTIKVWVVDKYENVQHHRGNYGVSANGEVHTLVYDKRYNTIVSKKGKDDEGYIYMTCMRDPNGYKLKNGSWGITFESVGGGIQSTNDFYLNKAPKDGYEKSIVVAMNENDENYSASIHNKKYYFTAHNENVFGSLIVTYLPYAKKDKCLVQIDYKLNGNGSRNLAIKPD